MGAGCVLTSKVVVGIDKSDYLAVQQGSMYIVQKSKVAGFRFAKHEIILYDDSIGK